MIERHNKTDDSVACACMHARRYDYLYYHNFSNGDCYHFYAPNFEEIEGAYNFRVDWVRPSISLSCFLIHAMSYEPCKIGFDMGSS